jgi:hypothetical protein
MRESPLVAPQQPIQIGSRRGVLRRLAGAAVAGLAVASLGNDSNAGKEHKKRRRRKRRKNNRDPAQPTPEIRSDATCAPPEDNAFAIGPLARLSQSFAAGLTGDLVRVDLGIDNRFGSSGSYLVRLVPFVNGLPVDTTLATTTVAATALPASITRATFTFSQPARVVAGDSYALVLSTDGDTDFSWTSRTGAACAGRAFVANGVSAAFEPRSDLDFVFTTFVQV